MALTKPTAPIFATGQAEACGPKLAASQVPELVSKKILAHQAFVDQHGTATPATSAIRVDAVRGVESHQVVVKREALERHNARRHECFHVDRIHG